MSLRVRERYTNSLYWFTFRSRATSSPQKTTRYSTKKSNQITTHNPPKQWPWTLQETHSLWQITHQEYWSWPPREHTPLLGRQHQKYRRLRKDYTCLQNNLKSILMQSYSTLLENPKLWCECSNLESTLSQLKNSNLFFFFFCFKT